MFANEVLMVDGWDEVDEELCAKTDIFHFHSSVGKCRLGQNCTTAFGVDYMQKRSTKIDPLLKNTESNNFCKSYANCILFAANESIHRLLPNHIHNDNVEHLYSCQLDVHFFVF